jgi:hypothetical protein
LPGATAPGLLCHWDGPRQQDVVQGMGHAPQAKVPQRALAAGRLLGAKAIQRPLPALVQESREMLGVTAKLR